MRWLVGIGIVVVLVGGAFLFRDRISGGAGDLQVGDCFDVPTTADETVSDVQHHPCTESHTAEVILVTQHPAAKGAPVPSDDEMTAYLKTTCQAALTAYVGSDDAKYDLSAFYPLEKGWNDNDRGVTCYLSMLDGSAMTASAKAS